MKITDDYNAKYEIWSSDIQVVSLPKMTLPFKFPPQKFTSYKAMNEWKEKLIVKIAEHGGVKWNR